MLGYDLEIHNEVSLNGIFIAKVIDNIDPKALERIRVRIIGVHDMENIDKKNSVWANHLSPSKQNSGEIPDINDYVYVSFLQGDPSAVIWHGWVRSIH